MTDSPVVAAGALVWRRVGRHLEVLLVHRPRYDDWSFPKGKVDPGETVRACAVREVEEETGVPIALDQPLGMLSYRMSNHKKKVVHYWAARELAADSPARSARPKVRPASTSEIDDVQWVSTRIAYQILNHEDERELLGKLIDQFSERKLDTWTVIVVRHSRAVKRSAWKKGKGSEETRPLTPLGAEQAKELVPLLSAYGVGSLISSPWERCVATLRPYAKKSGVDISERGEMTEAAWRKGKSGIKNLVDEELRFADLPTALCVHRPTLETVMERFDQRSPRAFSKFIPASDPWLKTGELFVAHVAKPHGRKATIVALEKFRPKAT